MGYVALGLGLCLLATVTIGVAVTVCLDISMQLHLDGYATLTLGPLWVMILPGYIAVSW